LRTHADVELRVARAEDMSSVCELVNHYIAHTAVNFRTEAQTPGEWLADWTRSSARFPWIVATQGALVVGLAYAGAWNGRQAYGWSCEVTAYVHESLRGLSIGTTLYTRLLALLDAQGYRTNLAVIALPNDGSVALHERFGFRPAGVLERVGYKFGQWKDVGFWQRTPANTDSPPASVRSIADVLGSADGSRS